MLKYCIFPIKGDELIYVRVKSREATLADFTFSRSDIKQRDCGIKYSCKIRNLVQYYDTNSCWHDVELLSPIRRRHQYNCIRPLWSLNIAGSSSSQPALIVIFKDVSTQNTRNVHFIVKTINWKETIVVRFV